MKNMNLKLCETFDGYRMIRKKILCTCIKLYFTSSELFVGDLFLDTFWNQNSTKSLLPVMHVDLFISKFTGNLMSRKGRQNVLVLKVLCTFKIE